MNAIDVKIKQIKILFRKVIQNYKIKQLKKYKRKIDLDIDLNILRDRNEF